MALGSAEERFPSIQKKESPGGLSLFFLWSRLFTQESHGFSRGRMSKGNSHDAGNAAREIAEPHQLPVPVEFQPVAVTPGSDMLLSLPVMRMADETEQHGPAGQA